MPIYEYQCQACGHSMDVIQKMSDNPLVECPECHRDALSKLVSASNFQLKGSGWYVTDFKDQGSTKAVKNTKTATEVEKAKEMRQTKETEEAKETKETINTSQAKETPKTRGAAGDEV